MTDSAPAHRPLPDPPLINWKLLFEMNGLKRGEGVGPQCRKYDIGMAAVDRHAQGNKKLVAQGMVELLDYLEPSQ